MKKAKIITQELLINQKRVTLLELLDRLLDKGVVTKGEIILSVADIDLIYLNLGLLLSSVKTVEAARRTSQGPTSFNGVDTKETTGDFFKKENPNIRWLESQPQLPSDSNRLSESLLRGGRRDSSDGGTNGELIKIKPRTNIDPNNVEKGLAKLVLTLIELLRKLMEKQAIRRMEAGFLNASEIERMGTAFKRLEERMGDLKKVFALKDEDLNLDLGPVGQLM